ncbi:hypothetical protein [Pseudomonas aeruginosa]|uniref:hypothetical protein n=1 Tax=Pseudomonas aeruginosa TaxID=287 RepID=UPI003D2A2401
MNADRKRHAQKIATYIAAVERAGFAKVEAVIGSQAAGKFELASDAHRRQQADYIVADFLADAQSSINDDDFDIYDVLRSA